MAFEGFARRSGGAHAQRLALSYAIAAVLVVAAVSAAAYTGRSKPKAVDLDEVVDVKFTKEIPEEVKPKEPEPEAPPPVLVPQNVKVNDSLPPPKPVEAPKEIPKEKAAEDDPSKDKGVAGSHDGEAGGAGTGKPGGTGTTPPPPATTVAAPPVATTPPPKPAIAGPIMLPEEATPPVGVATPPPPYPEAARTAGTQAVVIVKFVITETGEVTNVKIVKGDPAFDDVVIATVKTWRYKPAQYQGKPISTFKTVKIPFKIKT